MNFCGGLNNGFVEVQTKAKLPIPVNKDIRNREPGNKLLRFLDCAVIKHLHSMIEAQPDGGYAEVGEFIAPFDTVRGLFVEGDAVYTGGGFYELTHAQIAVRNDTCIKGVFLPR